ncbi:selenide, water dikinase SelD [Candidatus Formimonas warabiya]|uniref:Selenide, water dikinase n=1 Tax=Formimonas warabiya TaxID=1761012 RepID=A0A3G1L218_FORW1|nr:selenide, water dikinase SelD [Candidatus Formimonas warabiya]
MPKFTHPNLLVGPEDYDDAGVYKINDDLVLIQTVDFFTPMVDDPYAFGSIAAANALSDIYAMGGEPLTVMNVAAFPQCGDWDIFEQILLGGADKVKEAGALLIGGHTVDDQEPKYGLSVTGVAKPEEILTNGKGKEGDALVLTKRLGNGILVTAIKADMLEPGTVEMVMGEMSALNKEAALSMKTAGVTAATDITGFGFLGHLGEVVAASRVSAEIWADRLPVWPEAVELAKMGMIPAGCYRNQDYLKERVEFAPEVPVFMRDILFDPQTSGGLLMAVPQERLEQLTGSLKEKGLVFSVVGKLTGGNPGKISVKEKGKW